MQILYLYLYSKFYYYSAADLPPPLTPIRLTPSRNITLTPEEMLSKTKYNPNLLCKRKLFVSEGGDVPGVQSIIKKLETLQVEDLGESNVSLHPYYDDEP